MTPKSLTCTFMVLLSITNLLITSPGRVAAAYAQQEFPLLEQGKPIEKELAGGQSHSYRLSLTAGQYLHLVVDQRGVDVVVVLFGPDGKKLTEVDSPNGTQGPEPLSWVVDVSGSYRLEVRSLEKEAAAGRYEAKIEELRAATDKDKNRIAAQRAFAEGEELRNQGTGESLRKAIKKYEEALPFERAVGDHRGQAITLAYLGLVYRLLGTWQKALDYYNQALSISRAVGDREMEATTLSNIGKVYSELGENQKGLDYLNQALPISRAVGDRNVEASTLNSIGLVYWSLGEWQKALDYYNQTLLLLRALGDRRGEAALLSNIGSVYFSLGEWQKALDYYSQILPVDRALGDRRGEATTLINISAVYWSLGELQRALDYLNQALPLERAVGNRSGEATALSNIGLIYDLLGEKQKALDYHNQALPLERAVGDRNGEAFTLNNIGRAYAGLGEKQKALDYYNQVLSISRATGDRNGEATTLGNIGAAYRLLGEWQKGLDYFNQALPITRAVSDRNGEAYILYGSAAIERDRGNLAEARSLIEKSLDVIKSLRTKVAGPELRASYIASVREYYEFDIDLLMRLHRRSPAEGFDAAALQASESARARSLLDLLVEARADIRQGVETALLERERSLQQLLDAKTELQIRLLNGPHTAEQAGAAKKEIDTLLTDYEQVRTQIRATSPRYAALTQPQPLSLAQIQQQLDPNTLLLEYSLGEERSFLWAVGRGALSSYELPKRADVERAAMLFHSLMAGSSPASLRPFQDAGHESAATELSRMLLGPVASQLGNKRLIIVADGALQYVPFAALPIPGRMTTQRAKSASSPLADSRELVPLVVEHEIISLPSASTIAVLREQLAGRQPALKMVAVLADPVFSDEDDRVKKVAADRPAANASRHRDQQQGMDRVAKDATELRLLRGDSGFLRLEGTRQEAIRIAGLVPVTEQRQYLGFQASRATAMSGDLSRFRYVHFATHGLLDSLRPELSGIVLSLVDEQGRQQNGFLFAHEVYNLKLPAELVVLSACQSGLGKEIKGEGLIGLTRGFMYAGAARVMASLWKVDDQATADLMERFYRGVLKKKQRPAEALRAAQIEMWQQQRWKAPNYWAAFVLQGEWR